MEMKYLVPSIAPRPTDELRSQAPSPIYAEQFELRTPEQTERALVRHCLGSKRRIEQMR